MWFKKIYPVKKQDHVGKQKAKCEASGRPDATSWTTESQTYLSAVQEQDEQAQHKVAQLIEMFESHKHKDQVLKDMSQTKKINRFSEASQELLKDVDQTEIFELCVRIPRSFSAQTVTPSQTAALCFAVAGEIRSMEEVSHNFKKTTTISIRSMATSLRKIPVEDQSMVNLNDK